MTSYQSERIRIGISSCLLGEKVRYNGDHKRDHYITEVLSRYFEFVPYCPEMAIGLGVPRPAIRLEGGPDKTCAVVQDAERRDVTEALADYGREVGTAATGISGYLFKSRSPSCGLEGVPIHYHDNHPASAAGGIFVRAFMKSRPLPPVEEEDCLNDPDRRDCFIERVFVYSRWRDLTAAPGRRRDLAEFHAAHKFLVMVHDQAIMPSLERLVARDAVEPQAARQAYFPLMMRALQKPARRDHRLKMLQRVVDAFRGEPGQAGRPELQAVIDGYRRDELPLIAPLTLIRDHLRNNPDNFLENRRFPEERSAILDTHRR